MKTNISIISRTTIYSDLALLTAACAIPTLTHVLSVPLFHADPIRILLLGSLLIAARGGANAMRTNGILMAVLLPLISCLVAGMPALPKALLMVAELSTNVLLFCWLFRRGQVAASPWRTGAAVLLSILGAKVVYYGLKNLCIAGGLIQSSLVSTAWTTQIVVALLLSVAVVAVVAWKRK